MIGLAVGIDYSLFIVSRFRTEVVQGLTTAALSPRPIVDALCRKHGGALSFEVTALFFLSALIAGSFALLRNGFGSH